MLPNNYRESSYPVAVYRWHAENPTDKPVTVSVMLSWTNMLGWFRDYTRDMKSGLSVGNRNRFVDEPAVNGHVKGIVFDRVRPHGVQDDWDGQWAIASVESHGVEVTYQTTFVEETNEKVWQPFAKDGRLSNDNTVWTSSEEPIAGAIAVRFTLKPGEKRVVPMTISLHRFLRNNRDQCVEDRERRFAEFAEVERPDRCLAKAVCKRRKQAGVVSRRAVQ